MWVIVGLGNPGKQYSSTRHNAGFILVQRLADKNAVRLKKRKYAAKATQIEMDGEPVLLVKPWTYMNRSGQAVKELIRWTAVKRERLLVATDDLDLPLGEIRIRKSGGPGTHNGMLSIVKEVGSSDFPRIRIGIGPLPSGKDAAEFVLAKFQKEELPVLEDSLVRAEEAIALIITNGIENAMNMFNRKVGPSE